MIHRQQTGFTLLEILVVMVLIAIIAGMVGVNLKSDPTATVREEAQRLALLLQTAQEEAILQGTLYAINLEPTRYHFLRLDVEGVMKNIDTDALLRQRELPDGVKIVNVLINGADSEQEKKGFILTPLGDLPNFSIVLEDDGHRWQVEGFADGSIKPAPVET
ncbi:MAG: GspH/FimT family pseudopilin [Acidiferrobacterales bacterium]